MVSVWILVRSVVSVDIHVSSSLLLTLNNTVHLGKYFVKDYLLQIIINFCN